MFGIFVLLVIYIYFMIKIERNNKQLWIDAIISLAISLFSIIIFKNGINDNRELFNSFEMMFYPLFFTVLIFVLNFYSSSFLDKPFSFYFSKSISNLGYLFLPLTIRILLMFFGLENFNVSLLVFYTNIYYILFMFGVLFDVYKWNRGCFIYKYKHIYVDALVDLPFDDTKDNELYYQWQSFLDKNNEETNIKYIEIYTRRLNRLSKLRKTKNRLELDQFTMRMIELSVSEQGENVIHLSDDNEYDYSRDFLRETSPKFLLELLLLPGFKFDEIDEISSFSMILNKYITTQTSKLSLHMIKAMIDNTRVEELGSIPIKKEIYLALYKNNILDNVFEYMGYDNEIETEDFIIIDAIIQQHNALISKQNIMSSSSKKSEYPDIYSLINIRDVFDKTLYDDYSNFESLMDKYNKLFYEVTDRVIQYFYFEEVIDVPILTSRIVMSYYKDYYNMILNELKKSPLNLDIQMLTKLNFLLNLAHKLYYVSYKDIKAEIIEEVNNVLMHNADTLFDDGNTWAQVNYLKEYYTVSNGILNNKVRKRIESCLEHSGEYDIPFLAELHKYDDFVEKEKIIIEFYETYKDQFDNDKSYIRFEGDSTLVKTKYMSKFNIYKIFITNLVDDNYKSTFLDGLYKFDDFNIALGRVWVYDKNKYDSLVSIENTRVLLGVHDVLKSIEYSEDTEHTINLIDQIGMDNLKKFIKLFEEIQVVKNLNISPYRSINYIQELGIPYTINNFDEIALETFSTFWSVFILQMSKPVDFISDFLDSEYLNHVTMDCTFFYEINTVVNKINIKKGDKSNILENLIDMISLKKVINNKYKATNVFEYDYIIKSYNSIKEETTKKLFEKKILSKVEPYFISELLERDEF